MAVASCIDYTPPTSSSNATNFAWIAGTVFSVSGQGVAFAQVGVRIPTNRSPTSYGVQGGQTADTGDYSLLVQRLGDVGALPPEDTLTVFVLVVQQIPGGTRLDSTQTTLRFFPTGTIVDPQRVDVHTSTP
jgi:hypothetical protein